ncbi:hypothetical protein [Thiosulfatihalobacter marinus]|jgi:hypothetical protein|uniref:hypothetical protein n=1 Tax=Thiosulfatihalobacter marinus TaxID=2792481 RepID=UPI0018D5F1BD|nr:hypothetical protein [Thiosulfatihalobacter marinus]
MQPRHFISTVLAAALTITGISGTRASAAPDAEDIAKILFGTAAIVIIGKAIEDANDKPRPTYTAPTRRYEPVPVHPVHPRRDTWKPPHRNTLWLPAECAQNYVTVRGERIRGYGQNCLTRADFAVRQLPRDCARRVNTRRGVGTVYAAQCLSRSGYRVSGR